CARSPRSSWTTPPNAADRSEAAHVEGVAGQAVLDVPGRGDGDDVLLAAVDAHPYGEQERLLGLGEGVRVAAAGGDLDGGPGAAGGGVEHDERVSAGGGGGDVVAGPVDAVHGDGAAAAAGQGEGGAHGVAGARPLGAEGDVGRLPDRVLGALLAQQPGQEGVGV